MHWASIFHQPINKVRNESPEATIGKQHYNYVFKQNQTKSKEKEKEERGREKNAFGIWRKGSSFHAYQKAEEWKLIKQMKEKTNSEDWCERFMCLWHEFEKQSKPRNSFEMKYTQLNAIEFIFFFFLVCNVNREWRDVSKNEKKRRKRNSSNY